MRETGLATALAKSVGYCFEKKWSKETSTASGLVGKNEYHERFVGLSVPLRKPLNKRMKQGIRRAYVDNGPQYGVRRP